VYRVQCAQSTKSPCNLAHVQLDAANLPVCQQGKCCVPGEMMLGSITNSCNRVHRKKYLQNWHRVAQQSSGMPLRRPCINNKARRLIDLVTDYRAKEAIYRPHGNKINPKPVFCYAMRACQKKKGRMEYRRRISLDQLGIMNAVAYWLVLYNPCECIIVSSQACPTPKAHSG